MQPAGGRTRSTVPGSKQALAASLCRAEVGSPKGKQTVTQNQSAKLVSQYHQRQLTLRLSAWLRDCLATTTLTTCTPLPQLPPDYILLLNCTCSLPAFCFLTTLCPLITFYILPYSLSTPCFLHIHFPGTAPS